MRIQILLNYQLKNEVSWANFNTYKRIFNWQPFMYRVYDSSVILLITVVNRSSVVYVGQSETRFDNTTTFNALFKMASLALRTCSFPNMEIPNKYIHYISRTNRVRDPYCKIRTEFIPLGFMVQARSSLSEFKEIGKISNKRPLMIDVRQIRSVSTVGYGPRGNF